MNDHSSGRLARPAVESRVYSGSVLYQLRNAVYWPQYRYRKWQHRKQGSESTLGDHFRYRTSFLKQIEAVIENRDLIHDFDLDGESVVFDVGGHHGRWAIPIVKRRHCAVQLFEPSPLTWPVLEKAIGPHPGIVVHRYGLGASNFEADLSARGPGSSIFDGKGDYKHTRIEIRDVVEVFSVLDVAHVDVMKINIEGGEYDLLDRMIAAGLTELVDTFLIQFHEWIPHAYRRRASIRRRLRATHRETWNHDWIWERWDAAGR